VRRLLRSYPGWFAFQFVEYALLLALAKLLVALGLGGRPAFAIVIVLAIALVVGNYALRRRYLSDEGA
jgi:hypothetical protein